MMDSENIKEYLSNILNNCKSTFKDTSLDDRGGRTQNYLCQDNKTQVFDFDKYVRENIDIPLPASPDAVYLGNQKFYFVEFKNSPIFNINDVNIKNKFNSGTSILKNLLNDYLPSDIKFIFCVVYKSPQASYFNPMHIESNIIRFGLDKENINQNNFYSNIITEDVEFYKNEFKQLQC